MKIAHTWLFKITDSVTRELLKAKGRHVSDYPIYAQKAWSLITKCTQKKDEVLSPEASVAYWTALGNCNVTHEEIAELLTEERSRRQSDKKEVTVGNVKHLLHAARVQINICLKKELKEMGVSYDFKQKKIF